MTNMKLSLYDNCIADIIICRAVFYNKTLTIRVFFVKI